jgi:enoyl-CoA hydratase
VSAGGGSLVLRETSGTIPGSIATIIVNRPAALNALDAATVAGLIDAFAAVDGDPAVRCAILTGAGDKAFVAGADIKAMADLTAREARAFAEQGHRLGDLIEALRVPVIAAVGGYALGGGCELALACDFIYASRTAKLGQPEVGLGVIPGFGGTQRLARRVGSARARELCYTGAVIGAEEAARIGLVNAVVEPGELMPRVWAVAEAIAARAPLAVADAKRAIRRGAELPLDDANELERQLFAGLFSTDDQKEGMRAFVEKRSAKWTGR